MTHSYDVLITGGGVSGSLAAISCARNGARTLLIEQHGFLGGSLTAMGVGPMMTFHNRAGEQVVRGIAQELVDRLVCAGASPGHVEDTTTYCSTVTPFDSEVLKQELENMAIESGVSILYHSQLAAVRRDGERISAIQICNKGGLAWLCAQLFVDATGDGDLAARAGAPFVFGRASDGAAQPMTMNLKVAGVDTNRLRTFVEEHPDDFIFRHGAQEGVRRMKSTPRVSLAGFAQEWKTATLRGEINIPREYALFFETATPGVMIVNTSRILGLDATDPFQLTRAEMEGRRQNTQVFAFLKKYCAGFEHAIRCDAAVQIGVRESRHIKGIYTLTKEDLLEQRNFPDVIALGAYPIDIHSPDGAGVTTTDVPPHGAYSIPFRSLIVESPENLIVVGRCVSATSEAAGAIRVTPIAMAIGEAGGAAAALCVREGLVPHKLSVPLLQDLLTRQGVHLGNVVPQ